MLIRNGKSLNLAEVVIVACRILAHCIKWGGNPKINRETLLPSISTRTQSRSSTPCTESNGPICKYGSNLIYSCYLIDDYSPLHELIQLDPHLIQHHQWPSPIGKKMSSIISVHLFIPYFSRNVVLPPAFHSCIHFCTSHAFFLVCFFFICFFSVPDRGQSGERLHPR